MSLSDKQASFLYDVAMLILWCDDQKIKVTGGELLRTQYQQDKYLADGLTKAKHSQHQDRLAIDLNFYDEDGWIGNRPKDEIMEFMGDIADFWKGLSDDNRWGGDFTTIFDPFHFEKY